MRVIVTRPEAQATEWVARLQALGLDARALPLIDIAPLADATPLQRAWLGLDVPAFVMFVSANAVQHFFAARPPGRAWPAQVLAGAPGPGTAAALRAAGVPAALVVEPAAGAAAFDSEALWAVLSARVPPAHWQGRRVLVLRGEDGRDWLADVLRAQGAQPEFVAAYRRLPPTLAAPGERLLHEALSAPAEHLWLFSSSQALRHLRAMLDTRAGAAAAAPGMASRAAATHTRIAQRARDAGFGRVDLIAPEPAAVLALLRSQGAAA